ncbi:hypothetical protein [Chelativorans salis]|uniref:Uncharacterized protein n=1 Tax=Chelativorans salis TaxID=2978478 RepID=A0ABT2LMF5_9HYPH|nr:hypothetical protein [Chelativorans sp. EGI FJ00035]MCT7374568.1 hypothetical protein [Chelativorans sp. EGI FJ00035]
MNSRSGKQTLLGLESSHLKVRYDERPRMTDNGATSTYSFGFGDVCFGRWQRALYGQHAAHCRPAALGPNAVCPKLAQRVRQAVILLTTHINPYSLEKPLIRRRAGKILE